MIAMFCCRDLQSEFSLLLEDASRLAETDELVIFIDGIDLVETPAKVSLLGWLPDPVPKVFLFLRIFFSGRI